MCEGRSQVFSIIKGTKINFLEPNTSSPLGKMSAHTSWAAANAERNDLPVFQESRLNPVGYFLAWGAQKSDRLIHLLPNSSIDVNS